MSGMTMRTSRRTTRRGRIHPLQIVETRSDLFSTVWSLSSDSNTCNSNIQTRISMSFDRMGRRVEYLETADIDGITTTNTHHRFVYDGYLCIQRLDAAANNAIDLIFAWDPTEPVATRPLMIKKPSVCALHVTHDGNKNVSDLVFFSGGSGVAAHYEYAPFGALTGSTRDSTSTAYDFRTYNPFRFSSEYADDALGLVYYNYRHYDSHTGRWINRDPLVEVSTLGGYLFCNNCMMDSFDLLGLLDCSGIKYHSFGNIPLGDLTTSLTLAVKECCCPKGTKHAGERRKIIDLIFSLSYAKKISAVDAILGRLEKYRGLAEVWEELGRPKDFGVSIQGSGSITIDWDGCREKIGHVRGSIRIDGSTYGTRVRIASSGYLFAGSASVNGSIVVRAKVSGTAISFSSSGSIAASVDFSYKRPKDSKERRHKYSLPGTGYNVKGSFDFANLL